MPRKPSSIPARRSGRSYKPAATVIDARSEKAWRAVRRVTELLPTFTSFARAISGSNRVRVTLGSGGAETDGETIRIFPKIAFGEDVVHERNLCDKRGHDKLQLCKACAAREDLMFHLFHEIAHVTFDSAAEPLPHAVDKAVEVINEWHPAGACSHAGRMLTKARQARSYMELAGVLNDYVPTLTNAMEDARVNARMFRARPGLRVMFEAGSRKIFESGNEQPDGSVELWSNAPLNSQIVVGLLLMASGYFSEGYLSAEAHEVLANPRLERIASRAELCMSAHHSFELSIDAFRVLNEMGFCQVPKCEVVPPPPPSPPSETDDKESDDEQSGDGSSEDDGSAQEGSGDAPSDGDDQSDSPGETGSDDSAGSPGGADGGGAGEAEDQQDPDEWENADPSRSNPPERTDDEESDGEPDADDDGSEDSSGYGEDSSSQNSDSDPDKADSSTDDDCFGGSDDEDNASQGTDRSAHGERPGGTGASNDGDEEDSSEMEPSPESSSSEDGGDGSPDDDDPAQGESSTGEPTASGENDSYSTDSETDEAGHEEAAEPDVDFSESVWDDDANARAAASQYASPSSGVLQGHEEPAQCSTDGGEQPDHGDAATVAEDLSPFARFCDVHEEGDSITREERRDEEAVLLAIQQGRHFDTARTGVGTLLELSYPQNGIRWRRSFADPADFMPAESIIGRALMEARLAFEDNQRAREERNRRSGRLDRRAIGKRAPLGDDRMFYKRSHPGKKDYFFAIAVDVSGSTASNNRNPRILRAVFAQATLLSRLGHKFAIYGMTGGRNVNDLYDPESYLLNDVWVMKVKEPDEPWTQETKRRLADLRPCAENFDGHNMEYLRKSLDRRTETARAIIYYTDGEMPARNGNEELAILTNELATCKRRGYTVLAVGINTDSPRQYGLNTVQVDSDEDLVKVTRQLGEYLSKR